MLIIFFLFQTFALIANMQIAPEAEQIAVNKASLSPIARKIINESTDILRSMMAIIYI